MADSKPTFPTLMQMHVQALFTHDDQSRLLWINDGTESHAPRFFLGRTEQGNVWRFRHDLPQALCDELTDFCKKEPATSAKHPKYEAAYAQILASQTPIERVWLGPAYWFPNGAMAVEGPVRINEQNTHLLQDEFQDWIDDVPEQKPFVALIVNNQAVAICATVRITEAAYEAGVETAVAHRQKGYAVSVVSAWATEVEKMGIRPMYSTSFENHASQSVAARLGLARYGVDFHIT